MVSTAMSDDAQTRRVKVLAIFVPRFLEVSEYGVCGTTHLESADALQVLGFEGQSNADLVAGAECIERICGYLVYCVRGDERCAVHMWLYERVSRAYL